MAHEVELISPVLYVTEPREFPSDMIERVDVAAVTSPSAVNAIGTVCLRFASIGPTTSRAIEALGVTPWVEAPAPSFAALAGAIADQANDLRHHRA